MVGVERRLIATGGCGHGVGDGPCDQGELRVWDGVARKPVLPPLRGHSAAIVGLSFFAGDTRMVSIASDGDVTFWDVASGRATPGTQVSVEPAVLDVRPRGEEGVVAAVGWGSSVLLWDLVAGAAIGEPLSGPMGEVDSVALGPEGRQVAAGSCAQMEVSPDPRAALMREERSEWCVRGAVHVWDVASGAPSGTPLLSPGETVSALSFAHHSARLVSVLADGSAWLWDLGTRTGKEVVVEADGAWLAAAAFSRDDKVLATLGCGRDGCGQYEGELRMWVTDTLRPLAAPVLGHDPLPVEGIAPRRRLAFVVGDAAVVTASGDGAISWALDTASTREHACVLAGRNFGVQEWARHLGAQRPIVQLCPGLPGLDELPRLPQRQWSY